MNLGVELIVLLMMAVAVRGFLFEIKFQYTREKLSAKHELFEIFLDCPFCNGFWTGLFGYIIAGYFNVIDFNIVVLLPFAILVGATSFYLNLFAKKNIKISV